MKKELRILPIVAAAAIFALVSCTPPATSSSTSGSSAGNTFVIPSDDPYFPGKVAKNSYNALLATGITGGLNYLATQDATAANHFANFVDGLLLQNEFGTLEKQLAESIKAENNYQTFTIKVKSGVPWVRWDGTQYTTSINGVSTPQYVSANDFLTSAKTVLNFSTQSETYYLITNFIEGAMEYYQATYIDYQIANGGAQWQIYERNPQMYVQLLNRLVEENTGVANNATVDDIEDIRNFQRVGIKVTEDPTSNGGGTITYTLDHPAFYFPTLLTYSCYLPVNQHFLDEIRVNTFGTDNSHLLYCGPFTLYASTPSQVVYHRNPLYWNIDNVHVETINYQIISMAAEPDYARIRFEAGEIDGFTLTTDDADGWQKYITGPDNTGTIENPYDPSVNSRTYDYIDYVYGLHINVNRASNSTNGATARTSYATTMGGNINDILNAERALSIEEVRQLVIASFDLAVYCEQYSTLVEYQPQYMINTYVPQGFVQDDDGLDYTTNHYIPTYANHEGITVEEATEKLAQGQYDGTNASYDDLAPLREAALEAIELYNAQAEAEDRITFPIQMEFMSIWSANEESRYYDGRTILAMNQRLNNMPNQMSFDKSTSGINFLVIPTADVTQQNYELVTNGGNFEISATWGWGPDYGDPMSYLNTFTVHGDWASIFGYVGDEETINYYVDSTGKLVSNNLLEEYTDMVDAADEEYEDINDRYDGFAEAEYMLLNELAIFKPLTMRGQGRQVSVSRASGYHSPSGSYGLANSRLDGLYVLAETINREDRTAAYTKYEESKAAYLAAHGTINIY